MKFWALGILVLIPTLAAHAQGWVNLVNLVSGHDVNAPVYESDRAPQCSGS